MLHIAATVAVSSNSSMVRSTVVVVLCAVANTRRHSVQDFKPQVHMSNTHKCLPKMRKTYAVSPKHSKCCIPRAF